MVDSNCKGASVPDYNKSEGAKLGSFVINQRSGASKCRKTRNTTSHFDSQPLVNLVNYQSKFREEEEEEEASLPLLFSPSLPLSGRKTLSLSSLHPSRPPISSTGKTITISPSELFPQNYLVAIRYNAFPISSITLSSARLISFSNPPRIRIPSIHNPTPISRKSRKPIDRPTDRSIPPQFCGRFTIVLPADNQSGRLVSSHRSMLDHPLVSSWQQQEEEEEEVGARSGGLRGPGYAESRMPRKIN